MRVLGIAGSARRDGNSNSLLRLALEGAVERGAETQVINAADLTVAGCIACDGCKADEEQGCVVDDDMQRIYEQVRDSDVIVFASPVYFYGVSSWLKAVVDRMYGILSPVEQGGEESYGLRIERGKGFYLITTQEEPSPYFGYSILAQFAYGMSWLGMVHRGQLIATDLSKASDWKARPDLQAAARRLVAVSADGAGAGESSGS
jgi:multimeric flavodoxin WrbA